MILFAVQALFNGLAWAAWVCTYFMNALFNSMLKENFLTHKHLSWLARIYLALDDFWTYQCYLYFLTSIMFRYIICSLKILNFWNNFVKDKTWGIYKSLYALRVSCVFREIDCFFYERINGSKSTWHWSESFLPVLFFFRLFLIF